MQCLASEYLRLMCSHDDGSGDAYTLPAGNARLTSCSRTAPSRVHSHLTSLGVSGLLADVFGAVHVRQRSFIGAPERVSPLRIHVCRGTGNGYFALWMGLLLLIKFTFRPDGVAAFKINVFSTSERAISFAVQFAAGIALCFAVGFLDDFEKRRYEGYWQYALSVGIVGAVFSFIGGMLLRNPGKDTAKKKVFGLQTHSGFLAVFLFIWWAVAAGVITINGPFEDTIAPSANG